MVGIYAFISPSNRIYIGQSWDIDRRFIWYKSHKAYQQPALKNSFIKYGFDSHELKILHELPEDVSQEVLDRYEIFYMQSYKDAGFVLLNTKEGGRGGKHSEGSKKKISLKKLGVKKSEETKRKMGEWQKGLKHSNERVANMRKGRSKHFKPIIQLDLNDNVIKEWESGATAAKELGFVHQAISQCMRGLTNTAYGFKWKYA